MPGQEVDNVWLIPKAGVVDRPVPILVLRGGEGGREGRREGGREGGRGRKGGRNRMEGGREKKEEVAVFY